MRFLVGFLVSFIAALPVAAQVDELDGPYISYGERGVRMDWAYPEQQRKDHLYWTEATTPGDYPNFAGFHQESFAADTNFVMKRQLTFNKVKRVAALSDIHGQFDVARKLLVSHGIMNEEEDWTFGAGHLVIVGDVFDRGDQVTPTLWLIHHLQRQAVDEGGRVHFLLGNHETMVMEGDVRYINNRYLTTTGLLGTPYRDLFGPETYLGRWLRTLPLTVKINDVVYVHGGFSKEVIKVVGGLQNINRIYHDYLLGQDAPLASLDEEKLDLLYGSRGPLWYRGYFQNRAFKQRDIDRILKKLEANHLVVGHTSFDAIKSYFGNRVFAVDSSIKFGSIGELLLIEDGVFQRGTLGGDVLNIEVMK